MIVAVAATARAGSSRSWQSAPHCPIRSHRLGRLPGLGYSYTILTLVTGLGYSYTLLTLVTGLGNSYTLLTLVTGLSYS